MDRFTATKPTANYRQFSTPPLPTPYLLHLPHSLFIGYLFFSTRESRNAAEQNYDLFTNIKLFTIHTKWSGNIMNTYNIPGSN